MRITLSELITEFIVSIKSVWIKSISSLISRNFPASDELVFALEEHSVLLYV